MDSICTNSSSLPRCPVEVTLSLISNRWSVLILRELLHGTRRFGQIRKALGSVSTKVLTANLRTMEEHGLLTRETFAEVPPRVEYSLTPLGLSLRPILMAMVEWGSHYKMQQERCAPVRCSTGEVLLVKKTDSGFAAFNENDVSVAETNIPNSIASARSEGETPSEDPVVPRWNISPEYDELVNQAALSSAQNALCSLFPTG